MQALFYAFLVGLALMFVPVNATLFVGQIGTIISWVLYLVGFVSVILFGYKLLYQGFRQWK